MNRLIFPEPLAAEFRCRMLASNLETAGFVLAEPVILNDGIRFLASRTLIAPDEAYEKRSGDHIEVRPDYLAYVYKLARTGGKSVFTVHTHPWDGPVSPSNVDVRGEQISLPTLFRLVPNTPHGRLILGHRDTHCAIYDEQTNTQPATVWSVGAVTSEFPRLAEEQRSERYQRQVLAFGITGQQQVRRLHVAIVGLGGTGSIVAQNLAYLGIQNFDLIDPDVLDETNLNRVVGSLPSDVQAPKVNVARRMIMGINPQAKVNARTESVHLNDIARSLGECDFVFCCTDSHGSRAVLTQLSYQYFLPLIDLGVRIEIREPGVEVFGRVQMLAPGLPCLICGGLLDPSLVRRELMNDFERQRDPYISGGNVPQPAVVSLNTTIAGLAVTMFVASVTSLDFPVRYQLYRATTGTLRPVSLACDPECIVCSSQGAYGRGDKWPLPGRVTE